MQDLNGYIHTGEAIKEALRRNKMMGRRKNSMPVKTITPKNDYQEFLEMYVFDKLNMTPNELLRTLEHQYYSEQDFRNRRQRNIDFTRGRHLNEIVYDAEAKRTMTQLEYLKRRNLPPLNYNITSKLKRSLIGQFREINTGNVVRCESREPEGQEYANMLTECVERIKRNNKTKKKDANNMGEMLVSGSPVFKILWGSKNNMSKKDVRFRIVNPVKFGVNPGITDEDFANLHTAYEIHDTDLNSIVELFANGDYQKGKDIRTEYVSHQGDERQQSSYSFQSWNGEQLRNVTFHTQGVGNSSYRYIEVWTKISDYEAATYDPLEIPGNDFKVYKWQDPDNVEKLVNTINEERKREAQGDVDDEDLLMQMTVEYRSRWYVTYLTPWGTVLDIRESPYKNGMLPYVISSPDLNGEKYGLIEEILDAQLSLNRQIMLADNIVANASKGVWIAPQSAVPDDMTDKQFLSQLKKADGAVIINVPQGANPQEYMPKQIYAASSNVGNQVQQLIQMYSGLVDEISGNYGAAQGRSDSSAKTATGYALESQNAGLNVRDTFEVYLDLLVQRDELILMFILEGYTKDDFLKITGKDINTNNLKKYEFTIEQSKGTNSPAHRLALEQELLQLVYNQLLPFEVFLDISNNPVMIQAKQKLQEYNKNQMMAGGMPIRGAGGDVSPEQIGAQEAQMIQGHPQAGMLTESPVKQEMPKLSRLPQQNIV